ncbi:MAG: hypothetical protein HC884_16030, partial [Chloroflexaceae bacterium]|nr:hypothetical protein [Chloroflexaceae bacterium]
AHALPTSTPLPPTPTSDPALEGFSFCTQDAGDLESGRFSATISETVEVAVFPAFERLTIGFDMAEDSVPVSARAVLLSERDFLQLTGEPFAPADYVLLITFPNWLHDGALESPLINQSRVFTHTSMIRNVGFRLSDDEAGATLMVAIQHPSIYRMALSHDQKQLRVEVARSASAAKMTDALTTPEPQEAATLTEPLFFLLDGDVWRMDPTGVVSLTQSLEDETDLALSHDGQMVAFCRSQEPGISLAETSFAVPGSLWIMKHDGTNARRVAETGVNCADPVFSPDATKLAFSLDETGIAPESRSIKIVPVASSLLIPGTSALTTTGQVVARGGGWNRFGPQWVNDATLAYAASAPDGRSTIFLLDLANGVERDIGSDIQVMQDRYRYDTFMQPLVSPDGQAMAVEALRADEPGADLLLLDASGTEQDVIDRGYWTRPLAWGEDGSLFYVTTGCESTLVQNYEVYHRSSRGRDQLIAVGTTMGTLGDAVATGSNGLVYVVAARAQPGPHGPNLAARASPSEIWFWDPVQETRRMLFRAQNSITEMRR